MSHLPRSRRAEVASRRHREPNLLERRCPVCLSSFACLAVVACDLPPLGRRPLPPFRIKQRGAPSAPRSGWDEPEQRSRRLTSFPCSPARYRSRQDSSGQRARGDCSGTRRGQSVRRRGSPSAVGPGSRAPRRRRAPTRREGICLADRRSHRRTCPRPPSQQDRRARVED